MGLGVVVLALVVLARGGGPEPPAQPGSAASQAVPLPSRGDARALLRQSRSNAIVTAVDITRGAVVKISAAGPRSIRSPLLDLLSFPARQPRVENVQWIGSGFLIDHDGYIITAEHVVHGAQDLVVSLGDGTSSRAEVVGRAPRFDLALLRVDAGPDLRFAAATLGDSDDLMVGEWAIAIGCPFGSNLDDAQPSVSVGVISALNRHILPPEGFQGNWPYTELLQTDAAVNFGNSGGPLVNANGEVIGVNTAIANPTRGHFNVGVNFTVPINTVKWVAEELRDYGEVRTPWVGWALQEAVPPSVHRSMHFAEDANALLVARVQPNSPSARAGIEVGDVVLSINGEEAWSLARADRILFGARVDGAPIEVELLKRHDGQRAVVMLDVLENPATRSERIRRNGGPLG
jgi:serine protease Do